MQSLYLFTNNQIANANLFVTQGKPIVSNDEKYDDVLGTEE